MSVENVVVVRFAEPSNAYQALSVLKDCDAAGRIGWSPLRSWSVRRPATARQFVGETVSSPAESAGNDADLPASADVLPGRDTMGNRGVLSSSGCAVRDVRGRGAWAYDGPPRLRSARPECVPHGREEARPSQERE